MEKSAQVTKIIPRLREKTEAGRGKERVKGRNLKRRGKKGERRPKPKRKNRPKASPGTKRVRSNRRPS